MSEERTVAAIATAVVAVIALVLSAGALVVTASRPAASEPAAAAAAGASGSDVPMSVSVGLSEFDITPATIEVAQGGTLEITNDGTADHDLQVLDTDIATPMLSAGESVTLSLEGLAPGTYDFQCSVAGHAPGGMTGTLVVVGTGSHAEPADAAGMDHAEGAADEDWAALDAAMDESIQAFPAETDGVGNVPLEPEAVLDDGTKVFRLRAQIIEWEVEPGRLVEGWAYNGQIPGPLIRTDVGDKVQVVVENELPMSTDVHWHGVIVPNDQDGVAPLTQDAIPPQGSFTYEFETTEPAIGMYHPHYHGQIKLPNGLFGVFIIGDLPLPEGRTIGGIALPDDIEVTQELPMVLNDAGTIGLSLNGKSFPATAPIVAQQGEWVLIHYYNEGMQIHPMHLHGMPQLVVAKDGFPLDAPQWEDTVNVAPGERYSVLVNAEHAGVWVFHCHILNHAEREEGMFGMVTALIVEAA